MNTFKHKSLYAALAGLGALGATGVAQAVSVNPDGLGQVLIYPYYTVRTVPTGLVGSDAAYNSLLSVVNSTSSAKAGTAEKFSTLTCTFRRRTSGPRRSSRPRTARASSRPTSPARCRPCRPA